MKKDRRVLSGVCFLFGIGVILLLGWLIREEVFIRKYVALEPGIPEEQIVETEKYTLEITDITYNEEERNGEQWQYYKVDYKLENNSGEYLTYEDLSATLIREYKVRGKWYTANADNFSEAMMGIPGLAAGESEQRSFAIGKILDLAKKPIPKATDRFGRENTGH